MVVYATSRDYWRTVKGEKVATLNAAFKKQNSEGISLLLYTFNELEHERVARVTYINYPLH